MATPISERSERLHDKRAKKAGDHRNPFQKDRDRILYSSAFRRLAEVTQVVSANNGYIFHNRLTHSLQVAQVGRRLAEKLLRLQTKEGFLPIDGIDPDVVEAACLAHDLGHPPFGHIIEEELNELSSSIGGFEGNAQSFRIVTKLAFHSPLYMGLDLTKASLTAVLKYPWAKGENAKKPNKWGYYETESNDFRFARGHLASSLDQSSEAFLMDLADDITYSVHDLEDFYRARRLPLHLLSLQNDDRERNAFFEQVWARHEDLGNTDFLDKFEDYKEAFSELSRIFPAMQEYRGTIKQRTSLRNFTSYLIGRYINGVELNTDTFKFELDSQIKNEITMLKELIWIYVIQDPSLATQQMGQRHMIRHLFEIYVDASKNKSSWPIFPEYYRERLATSNEENDKTRACVDLIAGLTETQVHRTYGRLTGTSNEASLNDPLR